MADFFETVRRAARDAGYDIDSPRGGGKTALAKAAGMSQSSVGRMLAGQTMPSPQFFGPLAEALGILTEDLLQATSLIERTASSGAISAELMAKVKAWRSLRKLSAQQLADAVTKQGFELSRSVLANWENGRKAAIPVDFFFYVAPVLGLDLVELLTQPFACPACEGTPPEGFTCNTCGTGGVS